MRTVLIWVAIVLMVAEAWEIGIPKIGVKLGWLGLALFAGLVLLG